MCKVYPIGYICVMPKYIEMFKILAMEIIFPYLYFDHLQPKNCLLVNIW